MVQNVLSLSIKEVVVYFHVAGLNNDGNIYGTWVLQPVIVCSGNVGTGHIITAGK